MTRNYDFDYVTTNSTVDTYMASSPIFAGLIKEIRELSKKKPEATMSASKVTTVNRVLSDLLEILEEEPAGKYLSILDDQALPQMSDAVLMMVQFEEALKSFRGRYLQFVSSRGEAFWITQELLENWEKEDS